MRFQRVLGRLGGTLAGVAGVAVLMLVVSGGGGPVLPTLLLGIVLVFVLGPGLVSRLPRRAMPDRWTPVPAYQPAAVRVPVSNGRVAVALARPEARELALSPAFGAGLAFCATIVVLFGLVWPEDTEGNLAEVAEMAPAFVHPFVGMVILAVHRARTRSVRDGTEELLASCPTSQSTRTAGHLTTAWLPFVVTLVFSVGMVLLLRAQLDVVWGVFGARQVVAILSATVLALGGTALGVALARWAPWTIVPVIAVVLVGFGSIRLATAGGADQREPLRQLSTFLGDSNVDVRFTAPHYLARLGWLVALVVLVAIVALLKDRRSAPLAWTAVVAACAAVGFAAAAIQPIDGDDAERIAAVLNDLPAHQACIDAGGLDVCAFPDDGDLARFYASEVGPVAAAVPAGELDGVAVRAAGTLDRYELDPEVFALLDDRDPGLLPAEMSAHREAQQAARFWVALAAVGIVEDRRPGSTLVIADEARGVVALWLALRDARPSFVRDMTSFDLSADNSDPWRPWPDPCHAGAAPVQWAASDVGAARLLLDVPEVDVQDLLDRRWAWATDPTTTTGELLAAFGLEPTAAAGGLTPTPSC